MAFYKHVLRFPPVPCEILHSGISPLLKNEKLNSRLHIWVPLSALQVAVNSGGKHYLALSMEGEVYSWGEGDDGKLGHGGKGSCDRPRVVEALRGRDVVGISCGGAHSAAITATGALCLLARKVV